MADGQQTASGSELGFPGSSWLFWGFGKKDESNKSGKEHSLCGCKQTENNAKRTGPEAQTLVRVLA